MPLYEYECCAHGRFELYRSLEKSAHRGHCPKCERLSDRVISVANVNFDAVVMPADIKRSYTSDSIRHPLAYRRKQERLKAAERDEC